MSLTLVSAKELRELLGQLEVVTIGGEGYVNARELAARVNELCGVYPSLADVVVDAPAETGPVSDEQHMALLQTGAPAPPAPAAPADPTNLLEQERARLAALPPGPCAACTCPTKIAHPEGRCVDCDCMPYIDSTERDPIVTLAARGITEAADATIAPAVSMFDVASQGLDLSRAPMTSRFIDG